MKFLSEAFYELSATLVGGAIAIAIITFSAPVWTFQRIRGKKNGKNSEKV